MILATWDIPRGTSAASLHRRVCALLDLPSEELCLVDLDHQRQLLSHDEAHLLLEDTRVDAGPFIRGG